MYKYEYETISCDLGGWGFGWGVGFCTAAGSFGGILSGAFGAAQAHKSPAISKSSTIRKNLLKIRCSSPFFLGSANL